MSKTNHGTVEVTLGDEVFTLKPTLKAMKAIEGRFGGILPAMQSVGTANLSTVLLKRRKSSTFVRLTAFALWGSVRTSPWMSWTASAICW